MGCLLSFWEQVAIHRDKVSDVLDRTPWGNSKPQLLFLSSRGLSLYLIAERQGINNETHEIIRSILEKVRCKIILGPLDVAQAGWSVRPDFTSDKTAVP